MIPEQLEGFQFVHMGGSNPWGYLQIIHFKGIFHYKASILGYPHLWKPPYVWTLAELSHKGVQHDEFSQGLQQGKDFTFQVGDFNPCLVRVNPQFLILVGGLNPSEKYESQLGWLCSIYGKITNVPNHQPMIVCLVGTTQKDRTSFSGMWKETMFSPKPIIISKIFNFF